MAQPKLQEEQRPLILIIDDEESIRRTVSSVLEDEAYETATASSGEEGLEKVLELRPAVVFLDIWMPGWDGVETLSKIKEVLPNTEVIMMSGHATISNALEATKRGAMDFIEKPFDIKSVCSSVERALERQAARERGAREETVVPAPSLVHPGVTSTGLAGKNLGQRTLKQSAILYGQCLHSGRKSGLVLEPLPRDSGIHFARIGDAKTVPAFIDYVDSTTLATTIHDDSVSASTVEHLMAALYAFGISNLLIKCNGEVPIFDGSSQEFIRIIESIGIEEQGGDWFEVAVDEPVTFVAKETEEGVESITLSPSDTMTVTYELSYPEPVGEQSYTYTFTGPESFKNEISLARTFGFMKDIERLQKAGLAAGGRLDNFILVGDEEVVNTELRYPDEFVRHKVLDALGDLFLLGRPLRANVHARLTGHSDNAAVLSQLRDKILS
jgi:UDP-3-O-acyl N-acetylglucosamine deacetylase